MRSSSFILKFFVYWPSDTTYFSDFAQRCCKRMVDAATLHRIQTGSSCFHTSFGFFDGLMSF